MKKELLKTGVRYHAIYVEQPVEMPSKDIREATANLVANLAKIGYTLEENLLHQLNHMTPPQLLQVYEAFVEALQLKNNWTPLVKGWSIPTEEKRSDHWLTALANMFKGVRGDTLKCGHLIPENTFPLERYNGCPFCGIPFELNGELYYGQGSKLKVLTLWKDTDARQVLSHLLQSKVALDATQVDTLKTLLQHYKLPELPITMKETQMLVVDVLKATGKVEAVGRLFQTPTDIMRYLWYKHTGFLQLVEPKTILKRIAKNNRHMAPFLDTSKVASKDAKEALKLKYTRTESKMVAMWMNNLPLPAEKAAELMHPKRAMWVRFIRALRLAEYSKQNDMEKLKSLLDVFHHEAYEVSAGRIEHFRLRSDAENTFALLKCRPGLFARSLFANMLWFGSGDTLKAFEAVASQIPARLVFTLNSNAKNYFDRGQNRIVKPLGGNNKVIKSNRLLDLYSDEQLKDMVKELETLCLNTIETRFANVGNQNKTIFIDKSLFHMPMPIGDRAETVQDLPVALMGTRFKVENDVTRLFMQWGKGLKAQHLDMDLSCQIAYDDKIDCCSYYNLATTGAKHSGDIRSIPNNVGTAEYIELDLATLQKVNAKYVSFTCNAYSNGSISPNLVIGWMNSIHPMEINERTGVAYDPSCVQHQVRITKTLAKGLLFGVLDVNKREIIWMEQAFGGQTVANLNVQNVRTMLAKLESKTTVGNVLALKAKAQGLTLVASELEADEAYTRIWAMDTARISQLLI